MSFRNFAVALMIGGAAVAHPVLAQERAQVGRDWSTNITRTADGAYVLGNPAAKVRVIEYLSLTCSHCADFQRTGTPILKSKYVKPGLVSLEIRHAVRDGYDMGASLLARCDGPRAYFERIDRIFAAQGEWIGTAQRWAAVQGDALRTMARDEALFAMVDGAGRSMARAAGSMIPAKMRACVSNEAEQKLLAAMAKDAWETRDIKGTPAFVIDGQTMISPVWDDVEARIRAAL